MWKVRLKGLRRHLVWRFLSNCMSELWMLDPIRARLVRICGRGIRRLPAPSVASMKGTRRFSQQGIWVVLQWETLTWPLLGHTMEMLFQIFPPFQSHDSR